MLVVEMEEWVHSQAHNAGRMFLVCFLLYLRSLHYILVSDGLVERDEVQWAQKP